MPEITSSVATGAAGPAQQETINRNPTPDSETIVGDTTRFDSDFEYLASPNAAGAEKNGAVSDTAQDSPAGKTEQDGHTPEGKPPEFAVPPIAGIKAVIDEDMKTKGSLVDDQSAKAQSSAGERNYSQAEVSAIQSAKDTELRTLKETLQGATTELETLKSAKVALDELNRNPLAFVARYFPELAPQLDSRKVIVDRLRSEFGDELDAFDPSQAYNPESPSYKIQRRELELHTELTRSVEEAQRERNETARKQAERLNVSKAEVMKTYGLTEEQFQKEVVEWANGIQFDYTQIAKLKYRDWEIQRAVNEALKQSNRETPGTTPPNIALVGGGESKGMPEHLKELSDTFGDM